MNTNKILAIGAVLAIGYYLYTSRKKTALNNSSGASSAGTSATNQPGDNIKKAVEKTGETSKVTANFAGMAKVPLRVEDIRNFKAPVYVRAKNVIPNIYDKGVGYDVNATGNNGNFNVSGICSENVQKACKCADKGHGEYKLDIPSIYN